MGKIADLKPTKKIILQLIVWALFILVPMFLIDNFSRLSRYVPLHYYLSCFLLIPVFYLSNTLVKQKRVVKYLFIMMLFYVVYLFLPVLVCKMLPTNEFTIDFYSVSKVRQAKIRMGTTILFLIVWAVSIISYIYTLRENQRLLQEQNARAELSLLKSQINPHFLFNSLNSIYFLALKKADTAPKSVITLSDLMRYVLTEASDDFVLLKQELEYINKYLELQKLRLPEKTKLICNFEVDNPNEEIAPLLLIPFVENAFKYGISANTETTISILLKTQNGILNFAVENQIFETEDKIDGTDIGLENVKKRLALLYPNKHSLSFCIDGNSYRMNLEIELKGILS